MTFRNRAFQHWQSRNDPKERGELTFVALSAHFRLPLSKARAFKAEREGVETE